MTDLALPVELWLDILSRMDSAAICSLSLLSYFHRQLALPSLFATLRIDHTTSTDALRDLSRRGHILKHVQNVYLCALYPATPESDADMQRVIVGFRLCLAHMHQLRLLDLGNVVVSEYLFREIFTLHTLRCIATGPHAKAVAGVTLGDRSETLKRLSVFHIESAPLLRILEPAIKTTAMSLTNLLIPLALFGHLSILQRFTAHPPPRLTSIAVVDLACPTDYAVLYDFLLSVPNVTQLDIRSATCVANNPSFSTVLPKLRVLTCPAWLAEHLVPGRPLCTFKETPVLCIKPNVEHLTIFQNILSASPLGGTHPGGLTTLILSSSCQWGQYVSLIKGALLRVRFLSLCMLRGSTEDLDIFDSLKELSSYAPALSIFDCIVQHQGHTMSAALPDLEQCVIKLALSGGSGVEYRLRRESPVSGYCWTALRLCAGDDDIWVQKMCIREGAVEWRDSICPSATRFVADLGNSERWAVHERRERSHTEVPRKIWDAKYATSFRKYSPAPVI